jgi:hypothetical protein
MQKCHGIVDTRWKHLMPPRECFTIFAEDYFMINGSSDRRPFRQKNGDRGIVPGSSGLVAGLSPNRPYFWRKNDDH